MPIKLKKMWKAMRADVSALLIIAFVFQLVTPIVVLASDVVEYSEFEAAMRASICRVDVSDADEPDMPNHTDAFVCDFCVLCHTDTLKDLDTLLPEVASFDFIDGRPQPSKAIDYGPYIKHSHLLGPISPRAPPAA